MGEALEELIRGAIDRRCFSRAVDLCEIGLNRAPGTSDGDGLRALRAEARRGLLSPPSTLPPPPEVYRRGLQALGRGELAEAIRLFRAAVTESPHCATSHTQLGMALLAVGEFREGWAEHEWRTRLSWAAPRRMLAPRWDGRPMPGQTLVLWDEQGCGDAIQFIRFVGCAAARSEARAVFHGRPRLSRLFASVKHLARSIPRTADFPRPDAHASLMSIPAILGLDAASPSDTLPPYLFAEPVLVESWRRRLVNGTGLRVGFAWQGNPGFFNDGARSLTAAAFLPLLRAFRERAAFVSLQKGPAEEQIDGLPADVTVQAFGPLLDGGDDGFVDTAAVIANLDLVITTDTSVAHLAGALGAPLWILLGHGCDWRWGVEPSTTPFYPRARLYRRGPGDDWSRVFARVARDLSSFEAGAGTP